MASATQIATFIEQIAPCAQYAYKLLGKVKPSVCIGMACCECAYGTAGSVKYHSYLGHKVGSGKTATKYWNGTFVKLKTKEEYTVGTHTVIVDAFRTYESMQQCVLNFYELLNTSVYSKVKADADYRTQMAQIKACAYMTSSTEVNTVISIIEKYNLTKYDFNSGQTYKQITPELIDSIIAGSYGNGAAREKALTNEGYNYSEVRKKINDLNKIGQSFLPEIKNKAGDYWLSVVRLMGL